LTTGISEAPIWASDQTGTLLWTRTSGPNTPTLSASTSSSTIVMGLIAGTYVFNCKGYKAMDKTKSKEVNICSHHSFKSVSIPAIFLKQKFWSIRLSAIWAAIYYFLLK